MEMRFDPMTGEPINPQPQENAAQETGANTQEHTADAAQDVNAGTQDVSAGTQDVNAGTQDVSAGTQDVNAGTQQMNQQMEGSGAQQGNSQGETYSAYNGQPPYMPQTPADAPKNKNWIKGIAIAGGAAVVVIVTAVAVKNAMIGKGGKVLLATANTFKDTPTIIKESNLDSAAKLLAKGKYTVNASFDVSGDGFEGKLVSTSKEKQLSGKLDIEGISADGVVGISDTELKAYVPLISDDTFVYNFKDDNQEGYLVDLIEDSGIDIEDVNNALRQVTSIEEKATDKSAKQLGKDLLKEFNSWDWKKAEKKSCKVDGKTRKLKGYKVEITGDEAESMVGILEDYYKDQLDDMDYLKDFNLNVDDIDGMFDDIYDLCGYMNDVDVEFYIYKNKLAAVYVDDGSNTGEILFEGGDYRLQNVECNFENDYDDISFEIEAGKFYTLLGPSGSGKTTILRLIAGFDHPSSGKIYFDGKQINDIPANQRQVNTVFQDYALFPHMNVAENVAFGLQIKGVKKAEIKQRVKEALHLVQLDGYDDREITAMSGGQRQRVAIARAIVNKPKVLLLDEALSALDHKLRVQMQTELRQLQRRLGITFIFVTHDQEEALAMSDQIMIINDGKIQQSGTPVDIYDEPLNHFVADFIGESNIVPGIMKKDYVVSINGQDFDCVDAGMKPNEKVEVVIRPEDLDITTVEKGKLVGTVETQLFRGVDYQITVIDQRNHKWKINSIHKTKVGAKVGITFDPEDIHVMRYNESEEDFDARLDSYEEGD